MREVFRKCCAHNAPRTVALHGMAHLFSGGQSDAGPYLKSTQLSKTLAGLMRKAGLPDKAAAVPQQPAAKPQPNGAPE